MRHDSFIKHALLLFIALRLGDFVNVAAGMWFVPKYVKPEDIGAILPVTSFATFLSLPMFALAMIVMKESACLAAEGDRGKVKTLLAGVFAVVAVLMVAVLGGAALFMPRFLELMRVSDGAVGFMVVAAAFLGCAAPVYTDALQSLKRFRSLAAIEVAGAVTRFVVILAVMPLRALFGYFAGQVSLPLFRILGSVFALRRDFSVHAVPFWNRSTVHRMTVGFIAVLVYQAIPMATSLWEQSVLRTFLSAQDSAGYYMVSRFADFLHYLTFPLILVMFPYTANAAQKGESTRPYVIKCAALTLGVSGLMAGVYVPFGGKLLALMPNGDAYLNYVDLMPWLVVINALTTCQVFYTNAEVSAGRFSFLRWFIPLHLLYVAAVQLVIVRCGEVSMLDLMICFGGISLFRFIFSALSAWNDNPAMRKARRA